MTWFSGAAICIIVGACAGPVLAGDAGRVGAIIRGANPELLVDGAPPPLAPPTTPLRLRDAFRPVEEQILDAPPTDANSAPPDDEPSRRVE